MAVTPDEYYRALDGVKTRWIEERQELLVRGVIPPTWSPAGYWEGSPTAEQKHLAQLNIDISEYEYLQQRIIDGYIRIDPVGGGIKHFSTLADPDPPPPPPPPPPPEPDDWSWLEAPGTGSITTSAGTFYTADDVHYALQGGATVPGRQVVYLDQYDAFLIDGAPISWWIERVWYPGQKEALRELLESGEIPGLIPPPNYAWGDPVVPMPGATPPPSVPDVPDDVPDFVPDVPDDVPDFVPDVPDDVPDFVPDVPDDVPDFVPDDVPGGPSITTSAGTFYTADDVHYALQGGATVPGRQVVYLDQYDAFLIDGAPISWWIERVWYPGQKEALRELLESGEIPGLIPPPNYAWDDPVVPLPTVPTVPTVPPQQAAGGGVLLLLAPLLVGLLRRA